MAWWDWIQLELRGRGTGVDVSFCLFCDDLYVVLAGYIYLSDVERGCNGEGSDGDEASQTWVDS